MMIDPETDQLHARAAECARVLLSNEMDAVKSVYSREFDSIVERLLYLELRAMGRVKNRR